MADCEREGVKLGGIGGGTDGGLDGGFDGE